MIHRLTLYSRPRASVVIGGLVTLVTLLVGIILIGIQVRLEEQYLMQMHGDKYTEYRRNVRRWI
jgi:protein-S-isoprenylcysteine O-methyltransferase Ste14